MGNVSKEQKEIIEVARLVGLFLNNGFQRIDDTTKVPASEGYASLCYLEAVTLTLWAQNTSAVRVVCMVGVISPGSYSWVSFESGKASLYDLANSSTREIKPKTAERA